MSGIVKSIGKVFSRVAKSNVGKGVLAAAAVYYLGGMASGSFGDAATAAASAGDESAGLNMNPMDTGTMDTGGSNGFGGTVPLDTPPQPNVSAADVTPPLAPITPAPAPAPVQAVPAPTPAAQPAAPQPSLASTPAPAAAAPAASATQPAPAGTVGNLGDGVINGTAKWFKSLSPGAQAAIAGGVAGGAGALMNALAMRHAEEFQRERDDRARDDHMRRTQVPVIASDSYTPRSGIIDAVRSGAR
jgi:hypothetical protein